MAGDADLLTPGFVYANEATSVAGSVPDLGHAELRATLVTRLRHSHGGALLLCGFRGTGKTTLVERALEDLRKQCAEECVVVARLNVSRPLPATALLFNMMRRLVEELVDQRLLEHLAPDVRTSLLLAYARTSMSINQSSTEGWERSAGLSVGATPGVGKVLGRLTSGLDVSAKHHRSVELGSAFLTYSETDVEYDFLKLVGLLAAHPPAFRQRWWHVRKTPRPVRLVIVLDELDKLGGAQSRLAEFTEILGALKNVLAARSLHVLAIAGVEVLDESELESLNGNGIYESIFSWRAYVPALWTSPAQLLDRWLPATAAERNAVQGYLEYKSRGVPRRLLQEFNEMVSFDDAGRAQLAVDPTAAKRLSFYSGVNTAVQDFLHSAGLTRRSGLSQDRQRLACFYAVDWMLRTEGGPFTAQQLLSDPRGINEIMVPQPAQLADLLRHLVDRRFLTQVSRDDDLVTRFGGPAVTPDTVYRLSQAVRIELQELVDTHDRERVFLLTRPPDFVRSTPPPLPFAGPSYPAPSYAAPSFTVSPYPSAPAPPPPSYGVPPATPSPASYAAPSPTYYGSVTPAPSTPAAATPSYEDNPNWEVARDEQFLADGRYSLVRLVAAGGMGVVYQARDQVLQEDCAIKVIRPDRATEEELLRRLGREAEVSRSLTHPGLAAVRDMLREPDGRLALVMDYVDGPTLRDAIQEGLVDDVALDVLRRLLETIGYCHDHGVFRLDLKPENIILPQPAHPVVVDLGIAKWLPTNTGAVPPDVPQQRVGWVPDDVHTMEGSVVGTPRYMAPEQLAHGSFDHRVDLYALGVIAAELLQVHLQPRDGRLAYGLPDVPDSDGRTGLVRWLEGMLAPDPSARPASAHQALQELVVAADGTQVVAAAAPDTSEPSP